MKRITSLMTIDQQRASWIVDEVMKAKPNPKDVKQAVADATRKYLFDRAQIPDDATNIHLEESRDIDFNVMRYRITWEEDVES